MTPEWRGVELERSPDVQLLGDAALIRGAAAVDLYRIVARSVATASRRDGIRPSLRVMQILGVLNAAADAAAEPRSHARSGSADFRRSTDQQVFSHDEIDTQSAADILGCSRERVGQLGRDGVLRSRLVKRRRLVSEADVIAYRDERRKTA